MGQNGIRDGRFFNLPGVTTLVVHKSPESGQHVLLELEG